jgi:hypothetical protein
MAKRVSLKPDGDLPFVPVFAVAAFVSIFVMFVRKVLGDADTYWHLASGNWILQHGIVPTTDPFSWSYTGHPWTAHEWLSEVVMALAFRAAGWSGVAILTGLAVGLMLAIVGVYLRRRLSLRATLACLCFIVLGMTPSLLARPHVLVLPILAAWTVGLLAARAQRRRPSLWLLPLVVVWANMHASFVVGLGLLAAFALEAFLDRPGPDRREALGWGVFGLGAVLLTLLNPQTWQGLAYPFQVMGMATLPLITEWQSANFGKPSLFEVVLLAGLFISLWLGLRVPPVRLVILLGLLHLALSQTRQQMVFVTLAVLLLRDPLSAALQRRGLYEKVGGRDPLETRAAAWAVAGVLALAVGVRLAAPITRGDDRVTPSTALAAVPAAMVGQPMLNAYDFGGYLIFKGVRPFIDGRADMYGDAFVARYLGLRTEPAVELQRDLAARKVTWTLLEPTDPLVARLDQLPGWRRLYGDAFGVVHVRTAALGGRSGQP